MQKKATMVKTILLALVFSILAAISAFAEYTCTFPGNGDRQTVTGVWTEDENGRHFTAENGQVYVDHWLYFKNPDYPDRKGVWYYFDASGKMMQNQFLDYNGDKYFLGDDGVMRWSWFVYDGHLYYGGLHGKLYTSSNYTGKTFSRGNKRYTFDSEGRAVSQDGEYDAETKKMLSEEQQKRTGTGWREEGGEWTYWMDGQKLTSSWLELEGKWYYVDENGVMVKGIVKEIGGSLYEFTSAGVMRTSGRTEYQRKTYDILADGRLQDRGADAVMTERHILLNRNYNPYADNQTVQWINATYAIYTRSIGGNIKAFGGSVLYDESTREGARQVRKRGLAQSWGVTDRASADRVLEQLLTNGNASGSAWDYSRAVSNLGFYYQAGYYTETEAMDKALEVARIIQTRFDSWDSYNQSYLEGYNAWRSADSEPRERCLEELKASQHNPFAIDWNLPLEKSW